MKNVKVSFPDPRKIRCKDCKKRNKDEVKIGDSVVCVGATKSSCDAYKYKPNDILFHNYDCNFYEKE